MIMLLTMSDGGCCATDNELWFLGIAFVIVIVVPVVALYLTRNKK